MAFGICKHKKDEEMPQNYQFYQKVKERRYLSPKLLRQLLQLLQSTQRLLKGSLALVLCPLKQGPVLLYIPQSFTFKRTKKTVNM